MIANKTWCRVFRNKKKGIKNRKKTFKFKSVLNCGSNAKLIVNAKDGIAQITSHISIALDNATSGNVSKS